MPVESMLIGNIHGELPTIQESFATAIGSAPLLLGDLRKLSAADRSGTAKRSPGLRNCEEDANQRELLPAGELAAALAGHVGWLRPSGAHRNGVIAVFRNKSNAATANVQLPVMPEGRFKVHSVITNKDIGVFNKVRLDRGRTGRVFRFGTVRTRSAGCWRWRRGGLAGQISQYRLGSGEGPFAVDVPSDLAQRRQESGKAAGSAR